MGGDYRRWYGNRDYIVNWQNDGEVIRTTRHPTEDRVWATNFNLEYILRENINWSGVTAAFTAFRFSPGGELFASTGLACFPPKNLAYVLGFMNSCVAILPLSFLTPTLSANPGDIARLPMIPPTSLNIEPVETVVAKMIKATRLDWDAYERSWDFKAPPFLTESDEATPTLQSSYAAWVTQNKNTISEMKSLEEENNHLFIDAYGLQDELTPEVPIEQITLTVNPAYRYGGNLTEEEKWTRFREDTMQELVSYAIGCMMGRYSLDKPGLIYAHSGNEGFDPSNYTKFPADDDGIVPVTDLDWFDDDAANRVREFLLAAWGPDSLNENLEFLADNLGQKASETPEETIRRYLSTKFYKDHLQTYKKRPIYWLFSSGKQKAFECLVYLHRYNESTLSRMRNEYVIPLQGKYAARAEYLANEIPQASSASAQKKLQKELDALKKKQTELAKFDEELRHYADQRISIDLDDGVKVNYGKFGNLLAEVKAVTGKK